MRQDKRGTPQPHFGNMAMTMAAPVTLSLVPLRGAWESLTNWLSNLGIGIFTKVAEIFLWGFLAQDVVAFWMPRIRQSLLRGAIEYDTTTDPANKGLTSWQLFKKTMYEKSKGLNWINFGEETKRELATGPGVLLIPTLAYSIARRGYGQRSVELGYGPLTQLTDSFIDYMKHHDSGIANAKSISHRQYHDLLRDFIRSRFIYGAHTAHKNDLPWIQEAIGKTIAKINGVVDESQALALGEEYINDAITCINRSDRITLLQDSAYLADVGKMLDQKVSGWVKRTVAGFNIKQRQWLETVSVEEHKKALAEILFDGLSEMGLIENKIPSRTARSQQLNNAATLADFLIELKNLGMKKGLKKTIYVSGTVERTTIGEKKPTINLSVKAEEDLNLEIEQALARVSELEGQPERLSELEKAQARVSELKLKLDAYRSQESSLGKIVFVDPPRDAKGRVTSISCTVEEFIETEIAHQMSAVTDGDLSKIAEEGPEYFVKDWKPPSNPTFPNKHFAEFSHDAQVSHYRKAIQESLGRVRISIGEYLERKTDEYVTLILKHEDLKPKEMREGLERIEKSLHDIVVKYYNARHRREEQLYNLDEIPIRMMVRDKDGKPTETIVFKTLEEWMSELNRWKDYAVKLMEEKTKGGKDGRGYLTSLVEMAEGMYKKLVARKFLLAISVSLLSGLYLYRLALWAQSHDTYVANRLLHEHETGSIPRKPIPKTVAPLSRSTLRKPGQPKPPVQPQPVAPYTVNPFGRPAQQTISPYFQVPGGGAYGFNPPSYLPVAAFAAARPYGAPVSNGGGFVP